MIADIINISLRVGITCIVFAIFLFYPLKSRYRYNNLKTGLLILCLIAITLAVTILFLTKGMFFSKHSTYGIILWIVCAVLIFYLIIQGSFFESLFIMLVILNLYVNIMTIAKLIVSITNWSISPQTARTLISIGVLILYIPLLWFLTFRLYKPIIEFQVNFYSWRFIWIVPALTYLIFYVKIISDYWSSAAQVAMGDVVFSILWSLSSYIFFCVALSVLTQTYKRITIMEQTKRISDQLTMQEEQYQRLLQNIEETARIRHDWRHHLLMINGLVNEQKTEELKQYLEKLMPVYLSGGELPICENHVVNVILQHYKATAKTEGIEMLISADIPHSVAIPHMDLCIIFGNLVENAIEACVSQSLTDKSIEIKAARKEHLLVIMIKNTCDKEILVKNDTYYSTKHDGTGIGLSSVKSVVEKNKGYMQIKHGAGCFQVNIILNNK